VFPLKSIGYETEDKQQEALALAEQLHLNIDNHTLPRLSLMSDKLALLTLNFAPLFVDFKSEIWQKRRDAGKKQGLVRACKPVGGLRIIDATAGWGRDAAVLASFGADVTMIERQPIMAALLSDGLSRLEDGSPIKKRLSLMCVDTKAYLETLEPTDYPDVIYIDPMHPSRQKSALVKKDMQILQQLIGEDQDAGDLIQIARRRVRLYVVVKWPQRSAPLLPPSRSVVGKTVRFDVYSPQQ